MPKKYYTIMHTGRPYSSPVPADAWEFLSKHASAAATVRAMQKYTAHLSSGSWDDNYKIIDPDGNRVDYDYLWREVNAAKWAKEASRRPF